MFKSGWFIPICLMFFILVGILAYLTATQRQGADEKQANAASQTPLPTIPTPAAQSINSPKEAVEDFFSDYLTCLKSDQGKCSYSKSGYASDDLIQNIAIQSSGQVDPIVCSNTPPDKITVGQISQVTPISATAFVNEQFAAKKSQIVVDLKKVGDIWRLTNIDCSNS